MISLEDAERQLRAYVRAKNEDAAVALFQRVVNERTEAMHQRAQTAESRASKAERDLVRFTKER